MKIKSLVLFKNNPATILNISDKIEIELPNKSTKKVREKDIELLHEGPFDNLEKLTIAKTPEENDLADTRELLLDSPVSLSEFSELLFGDNTPEAVWSAYMLLNESLYFKGDLNSIESKTEEEVNLILSKRAEKENAEIEKQERLKRISSGNLQDNDSNYLKDVISVALKQSASSHIMQELNITQTPENAHALLLKTKIWDKYKNPYPERICMEELPKDKILIPDLPDEDRRDLTYLDSYAIDDKGSNDPDDAISIDGEYIWVHIADVASIIPPDSELDKIASSRGANLYLPEKTITMLPEQITDKLALGLEEISPALSFKIKFDDNNDAKIEEITPSLIKVTRTTYDEVNKLIDEEPFKSIFEVTERYRNKRIENGSIEIELPEVKVKYNNESNKVSVTPISDTKSRRLVTNAMLMTGEAVSRFAADNEIPIPYATQELREEIHVTETLAGMFSCRMKLKPVALKDFPKKHSGLGLEFYTRVTSPLRRYVDLLVHQQLRAFLKNELTMGKEEVLEKATSAATKARDITYTERCSNKHWTIVYMEDSNWSGEAVFVDTYNGRATYLIPELAYEFKMSIDPSSSLNSAINVKFTNANLPYLAAHFTKTEL